MRAGSALYCSGQLGLKDGELVAPDTASQLRQAIANLTEVLASEGAGLADVVKTTVFLVDIADYASMNDAYVEAFGDSRPARAAVAVAALPRGARVEIEAVAHLGARGA